MIRRRLWQAMLGLYAFSFLAPAFYCFLIMLVVIPGQIPRFIWPLPDISRFDIANPVDVISGDGFIILWLPALFMLCVLVVNPLSKRFLGALYQLRHFKTGWRFLAVMAVLNVSIGIILGKVLSGNAGNAMRIILPNILAVPLFGYFANQYLQAQKLATHNILRLGWAIWWRVYIYS